MKQHYLFTTAAIFVTQLAIAQANKTETKKECCKGEKKACKGEKKAECKGEAKAACCDKKAAPAKK